MSIALSEKILKKQKRKELVAMEWIRWVRKVSEWRKSCFLLKLHWSIEWALERDICFVSETITKSQAKFLLSCFQSFIFNTWGMHSLDRGGWMFLHFFLLHELNNNNHNLLSEKYWNFYQCKLVFFWKGKSFFNTEPNVSFSLDL